MNLPFVTRGYEKYIQHGEEQQRWLQDPQFLNNIAKILYQVQRVKHVTFDDSWISYQSSSGTLEAAEAVTLEPG